MSAPLTRADAMQRVLGILNARYPNYDQLPNGERVLLAMSVLANDIKVHEEGGNNHGAWVKVILAGVELPEGYPWCAASIEFACDVAAVNLGPGDRQAAAVAEWVKWANANGRRMSEPKRGRLCFKQSEGISHMAIVATFGIGKVRSYEGNTSDGEGGSQQDGGGMFNRTRNLSFWDGYIGMD